MTREFTHIHVPSGQPCCIKKVYGPIATVYVEEYPISITWGKEEWHDTIIVKLSDLTPIKNGINYEKAIYKRGDV